MEGQPGVFDPLYRSMVDAGEGSGRLEDALDRVAFQLEKLDALRRQVKSALMYPAVVFALALVVMIVVVAFIVPVFVGIFEEIADESGGSAELPFMTQITVGVSDFITGKWYIILPTIALATYAFLRWKKTERGRLQWDRLKLRLPFHIGDVVAEGRPRALVADLLRHGRLRRPDPAGDPDLGPDGRQRGDRRRRWTTSTTRSSAAGRSRKPLTEHAVFPAMVSQMVSVGEDSGQLETMLEKIADFYDAEVDAKVKALTSLIEPVMIMFVGGIVGFIVISMYLPIFSLYDNIR